MGDFISEFCYLIFIKISLKFVTKGLNDKKSAVLQVMAWHLASDKPLPELHKSDP